MIEVDLDFIIKGIESQGATCIVKSRKAILQKEKSGICHSGTAITFIHKGGSKEEFTLFVANKESKKFHCLRRNWNNGKLPQVFWFVERDNILSYVYGMYV